MAVKFLDNLDLNDNQLLNARLENLASDPGSANTGDIIYNSTSNLFKYYNGSSWVDPSAGTYNQWTLQGDSGSNQAIIEDTVVDFAGGTGINTATTTNTLTINLAEATSTVRGGIELFSDTDQSVAANTVSTTAARTYGIQLNSSGQAVVNVPWADTVGGEFGLAGDSGSTQTIDVGASDTLTIAGGTGISTAAGATDTVTITNTDITSIALQSTSGSNSTIVHDGTIKISAGTGITTTGDGSGQVTIAATGSGSMSSFTLTGDSGSNQTISDGDTLDIEGGTLINTQVGATDKLQVNHDSVTRSDGGSSSTLAFGGTFTATDGVTSTAQGHVTGLTTKTYTLPSAPADTNTTYTLDARAVAADSVALDLDASTGTDSTVSLQKASDNNIAIVRSSATLVTFGLQNSISLSGEVDTSTLNVNSTSAFGDTLSMEGSKITNLLTPTAAADAATKGYVDTSVVGNLVFQGGYDAATNTPDLDSSPSASIKKGWSYVVTAAGSFFTETVEVGDFLIAQQDAPTTLAHWVTVQNNIGIATTTTPGIASFAAANFAVSAAGAVTLADTTVTAATYGSASAVPVFAVNAKGQVTSVTNTNISIAHTAITDFDTEVNTLIKAREFDGTNSGTGTSHTFTHNLGTRNVIVQLYDSSTYETVFAKVVRTSTSVVTVTTASSLSAGEITALITVID